MNYTTCCYATDQFDMYTNVAYTTTFPTTEKLTPNHSQMDKETFNSLPSSTNAVESHNRLSKSEHAQILKVAMMGTYRKDMSTSLELMAQSRGLPTTYDDLTESARVKRSRQQSASRRKRLRQDPEDNPEGPPDSKKAFQQGTQSICYNLC